MLDHNYHNRDEILKILNFFKKSKNEIEKKSYGYTPINLPFSSISSIEIDIQLALNYYSIISSVSTSIDLIGDEFQSIKPLILDKKKKEFILDNPLLNLLNMPNSDQTKTELLGSIVRFYTITGNAFLIATGEINREPLELYSTNPAYIDIQPSSQDQFPEYYMYNSNNINIKFSRIEKKGRFRFVNEANGFELWHIRDFNSNYGTQALWGQSRLNSIYLEMNQYLSSNIHNLSVLKEGVRSSGILTCEQKLNQDQYDKLISQLKSDHSGAVNAGKIFLLEGSKFDFKELSKSLKDMDFKDLMKEKEKTIYTRLKIPLPLVSTENQKFDNMFQAKLGLYDNTVIPLIEKIFKELDLFLMPRYNMNPNDFMLWFNIFDVQVLKERELLNIERLAKLNILTINELRALYAREKISGGDILYQPLNLVPLGTTEQISEAALNDSKKMLKLKEALKQIKYQNGNNVYSL